MRRNNLPIRTVLFGASGVAVVALGVLVWLIAAGPGYWGYGASLFGRVAAAPEETAL